MRAFLGGLAAGGAVVAASWALIWPSPPQPPPRREAPPAVKVPPAPVRATQWLATACPPPPVPAELAERRARLEALQQEVDALQAELDAVIGVPLPFPDDLPETHRPEQAPQHVADAVAAFDGAEVHFVDCSEYPCLAAISAPDEGFWGDDHNQDRLDAATGGQVGWKSSYEGRTMMLLTLGEVDDSAPRHERRRLHHRWRVTGDALRVELLPAEEGE